MSSITVEVIEDVDHPEGGHAIIRLRGLKTKPDNDAFVIEHAGHSRGQTAPSGWPAGVRTPLKTMLNDNGFDIMVGPDVVENPVLLPGTPVVIKVPGAGVVSQVLWPDIKPLRRQKVKRIITSTDRRNAIARAQNHSNTGGLSAGAKGAHSRNASSKAGDASSIVRSGLSGADGKQGASSGSNDLDHRAVLSTLSTRAGQPLGAGNRSRNIAQNSATAVTKGASTPPTGRGAATRPATAITQQQAVANRSKLPGEPTAFAPDTNSGSSTSSTASSGSSGNGGGQPDWSGGMTGIGKAEADKGVVGSTIIHTQPGKSRSIGRAGAFAIFSLAAALVAGGVLYKYVGFDWPSSAPVSDTAQVAQPLSTIYEAFRAGAVSPRGIAANQASMARSIEQASASLYGVNGKHDSVEAAFWLKKYLAKQMADKQLLWALTQLGSTYAQPVDGAPDYFKARMLWETAAALGDPVAACFLGGLHEFGLGISASKPAARKWYQQAKSTGGCRFLDKAIARVADQ